MAKDDLDHLTIDSDSGPARPAASRPPKESEDIGFGPTDDAMSPGDSARAAISRQRPVRPGDDKPNAEKPTLTVKSPGDQARDAIFKAAKRSEIEKDETKLEDLVGEDKALDARFGKSVADSIRARRGQQPSAEDDLAAADDAAERGDPSGEKAHGNKRVEIWVNRKRLEVPMSDLKTVLMENGISKDDVAAMTDKAIIASAQTALAFRERLALAKKGEEVDDLTGEVAPIQRKSKKKEEEAPPQPEPLNLEAEASKVIEEMQYGDQTKASKMLVDLLANVAAGATHYALSKEQERVQASTAMQSVDEVMAYYEKGDNEEAKAYRAKLKALGEDGPDMMYAALAKHGARYVAEELAKYVNPAEYDLSNKDVRGKLYLELRRQGAPLPTESEITRQAYRRALSLSGPSREPSPPARTPAVNLSNERIVRRDAVTTQPRASSAVPAAPAARSTPSDVVAKMRQARGQPV